MAKGFSRIFLLGSKANGQTSIVPRVCIEVKFEGVSTHDAIVYSAKAARLRTVYPYLRYGLVLGCFADIPLRVLRHGQEFDFIVALAHPFDDDEINSFRIMILKELKFSRLLSNILARKVQLKTLWRKSLITKNLVAG